MICTKRQTCPQVPCGLDEVKQFQTYLSEHQINIVSKDHQNSIIYSGPEKEKRFICFCMITIITSSQACSGVASPTIQSRFAKFQVITIIHFFTN